MIYELSKLPPKLMLGKAGENMATEIGIDISEWAKAYPSATYSIVFQRADKESYPVVMANQGNVLVWKPSATDLLAGYGKLEVRMYDGEVIAKSVVIVTYVTESIEVGEYPDEKAPDWVQDIIDAYIQISPATTERLGLVKPDGETITADEDGTIHGLSIEDVDNELIKYATEHHDELKGDKGDKGDKGKDGKDGKDGTDGKTPVKGVDYFTSEDMADLVTSEQMQTFTDGLNEVLGQFDGRIKSNASASADNSKDIDRLYKLTQGQAWDFEQQTESGVQNPPSGAKYESVLEAYGNTEQTTYNGYNLLKDTALSRNKAPQTKNGITLSIVNGTFVVSGTSTSDTVTEFWMGYQILNPLDTSSSYTLTPKGLSSDCFINVGNWGNVTSDGVVTATMSAGWTCGLSIMVVAGATVNTTIILQMEVGSVAHDYEPYVGGIPSPNPEYPQEIKAVEELNFEVCGRNLFNFNKVAWNTRTREGITATNNHNGTFTYNGTHSVSSQTLNIWFYGDFSNYTLGKIENAISPTLPAGTYSVKDCVVFILTEDLSYKDSFPKSSEPNETTFTLSKPFRIMAFRTDRLLDTQELDNVVYKPTFEMGSTLHDYEPYNGVTHKIIPPFPLHKIGNYADKLDVANGVWEKKISNHRGMWRANYYNSGNKRFTISVQDGEIPRPEITMVYSDIYWYQGIWVNRRDNVYTVSNQIFVHDYRFSDIAEFTAWLANNPITIAYVMAEYKTTPISAEDKAFLDTLQGIDVKNIIVTDQNGNDVSYLVEYIVKLNERSITTNE